MWQQMMALLKSFFIFSGVPLNFLLIGIFLGIAFGAVWLCAHWPPLFRKPWLWVVMVVSAFLTVLAVALVQMPFQLWLSEGMAKIWNQQTMIAWLLLLGVPQVLISGLVQEGSKMVPMAVWWWRSGRSLDPRLGLAIGAVAGAGFGIFEAVWVHNQIFAAGWTAQALQTDGFLGIAGFWERFFAVGFHIAVSALVGYGLAKGRGWQYYLIAAGLHALLNYGVVVRQYVFLRYGFDTLVHIEVFVAVLAVIVAVWVLLIRWSRSEGVGADTVETGMEEPPRPETGPEA